jgi:ATP adenylyltransferase
MDYFFTFAKGEYVRGKRPDGCILCRLDSGDPEVEDLTIFRSSLFGVTVNLYPFNPGHVLIYPRRHLEDARTLSPEEEYEMWRLRNYCLDMLDEVYSPHAYNIGVNMGLEAGASLLHYHLHIIPRFPHEIGIPELIGGKRVLVEDPRESSRKLREYYEALPFSIRRT